MRIAAASAGAASIERQQLERRRASGARWFYWVAGLSLVNSIGMLTGQHWRFVVGLGFTQVVDALAARAGRGGAPAALLDLLLIGGFVLLGHFASRGEMWAFGAGLALYGLDGLIFLAARDWLGLGFHAFVLVMIGKGFQATRQLATPSR